MGIWWGFHSSNSDNNTLARSPTPIPQPAAIITPGPVQSASTTPPAPATQPTPAIVPPATAGGTNTIATTTQQPSMPTPPAADPNAIPAPIAATTLPAGNIPSAPLMTPIDPALQPSTTTANDDTPKKRRHRRQDNNVSGFAMALPEPGL